MRAQQCAIQYRKLRSFRLVGRCIRIIFENTCPGAEIEIPGEHAVFTFSRLLPLRRN